MMSRKHYRAFAQEINMVYKDHLLNRKSCEDKEETRKMFYDLMNGFASVMKRDNPNFDKGRFYEACVGVESL